MKTIKDFIYEKLDKPVKEGDTLLNTSNGTVKCFNRNNLKFLDIQSIESDYKLIDGDCKFLTFEHLSNGYVNGGYDEVNRKLTCLIMNEVKYYKDLKKMEKEVRNVVQKYSDVDLYKVEINELKNRWNNISGNAYFVIKFNRVAELSFIFYPEGYEEIPYKVTKDGHDFIIHRDED